MFVEFNQLIGIPYDIKSAPGIEKDLSSVNCQKLVHECYGQLGIILPPGLWSKEIFYDGIFFRNVNPGETPQLMDIFCFGQHGIDPRRLHLGLFTGEEYNGNLKIIHSSYPDGVKYDMLLDLLSQPKYSHILAVKRLKPEFFDSHILPFIQRQSL